MWALEVFRNWKDKVSHSNKKPTRLLLVDAQIPWAPEIKFIVCTLYSLCMKAFELHISTIEVSTLFLALSLSRSVSEAIEANERKLEFNKKHRREQSFNILKQILSRSSLSSSVIRAVL